MVRKVLDETAPPAPCTTRPISMIGSVVARPLITTPTERVISTTTIILSLPTMSPIRPRMGVAMAELNRYPVRSQLAPLVPVCRVCSSCGMAGMISDWRRLKARAAVASTTNVAP